MAKQYNITGDATLQWMGGVVSVDLNMQSPTLFPGDSVSYRIRCKNGAKNPEPTKMLIFAEGTYLSDPPNNDNCYIRAYIEDESGNVVSQQLLTFDNLFGDPSYQMVWDPGINTKYHFWAGEIELFYVLPEGAHRQTYALKVEILRHYNNAGMTLEYWANLTYNLTTFASSPKAGIGFRAEFDAFKFNTDAVDVDSKERLAWYYSSSVSLAVALRKRGVLFDAVADIESLTLGIKDASADGRSKSDAAEFITTTLVDNPDLTDGAWTAGTAAHATFNISPAQALTPGLKWVYVQANLRGGGIMTFYAGNVYVYDDESGAVLPTTTMEQMRSSLGQMQQQLAIKQAELADSVDGIEETIDAVNTALGAIAANAELARDMAIGDESARDADLSNGIASAADWILTADNADKISGSAMYYAWQAYLTYQSVGTIESNIILAVSGFADTVETATVDFNNNAAAKMSEIEDIAAQVATDAQSANIAKADSEAALDLTVAARDEAASILDSVEALTDPDGDIRALQLTRAERGGFNLYGGVLTLSETARMLKLPLTFAIDYEVTSAWTASNKVLALFAGVGSTTGLGIWLQAIGATFFDVMVCNAEGSSRRRLLNGETIPVGRHALVICIGDTIAAGKIALTWYLDGVAKPIAADITSTLTHTNIAASADAAIGNGSYNPTTTPSDLPIIIHRYKVYNHVLTAAEALAFAKGSDLSIAYRGAVACGYGVTPRPHDKSAVVSLSDSQMIVRQVNGVNVNAAITIDALFKRGDVVRFYVDSITGADTAQSSRGYCFYVSGRNFANAYPFADVQFRADGSLYSASREVTILSDCYRLSLVIWTSNADGSVIDPVDTQYTINGLRIYKNGELLNLGDALGGRQIADMSGNNKVAVVSGGFVAAAKTLRTYRNYARLSWAATSTTQTITSLLKFCKVQIYARTTSAVTVDIKRVAAWLNTTLATESKTLAVNAQNYIGEYSPESPVYFTATPSAAFAGSIEFNLIIEEL